MEALWPGACGTIGWKWQSFETAAALAWAYDFSDGLSGATGYPAVSFEHASNMLVYLKEYEWPGGGDARL